MNPQGVVADPWQGLLTNPKLSPLAPGHSLGFIELQNRLRKNIGKMGVNNDGEFWAKYARILIK